MARESAAGESVKRVASEREPGAKKRPRDSGIDASNKILLAAAAGMLFGAVAMYAYDRGNYMLVTHDKYDQLLRGAPTAADPAAVPAPARGAQSDPPAHGADRTVPNAGDKEVHSPASGKLLGEPEKFDLTGSPSKGPENAKVTLIEFSDFQCPACSHWSPAIDRLMRERSDRVRVVFKHLPLPQHDHSREAAHAAEAAARQGKFWPMAELLFQNQDHLERADLLKYAGQIGLDVEKFKSDIDSAPVSDRVKRDFAEAERTILVSERPGAPAFFLNGRRADVGSPEQLAALIDMQ